MKTIRQQLTRKLLAGFALLLALGGAGIYFSTRAALVGEFDHALTAKAMAVSSLTKQEKNKTDVDLPDRLWRGFDERSGPDFFEIWDTNQVPLDRSDSLGRDNLPIRFGTVKAPEFWNLKLPSGSAGRAVGFVFAPENEEHEDGGGAVPPRIGVVVASDRRELDNTLTTLALVLGASGLVLLIVTALVVPHLLQRELSPLDELAGQAARINADSLHIRFPTESLPGELTPISSRLNDLLERLEQSFERERRFSADLAHELRTPIAELRSFAELALKWPEAREAQTDREVLAIAAQMEGMVTRLLALLRSERGLLTVTPERVALAPLVESVCKSFAAKAAGKELHFSAAVPANTEVHTDPVLLRSILSNLIDNAVEYAPRGGTIQIESAAPAERFTLRVTNSVEQFEAADVPKLFDRFWRKDAARSNNEHSGLGLSLSRAFARALGFDLIAALDREAKLTFTLSETAARS